MTQRLFTVVVLAMSLLTCLDASGQSFFDDFEDGNLTDGMPVTWSGPFIDSGDVIADNGDMVLPPVPGEPFTFALADADHSAMRIELKYETPADQNIFLNAILRDTRNGMSDGYFGGLFPTGELFIGYLLPSGPVTVESDMFLPSGAVAAGQEITLRLEAIDDQVTVTAWETDLGIGSAASISWTDPLDRYPTGTLVYPSVTPRGSSEAVRLRSFRATVIPEPSSVSLFIFPSLMLLRSGRCRMTTILRSYEL